MNMIFKRKLLIPQEVKEMYPISEEGALAKKENDRQIADIFEGRDDRLLLIIGPCSADRGDAVIDYITRLRKVQEEVKDRIFIIPRIYTNKPRTTGAGYKGMLHQPDPLNSPDMLKGLISIRKLHMRAINETGFSCADEMLYPENHKFLSDLLSYVAVGARSVENQQHRLTASGLDVPVGMKNPTGGDLSVNHPNYHYEDLEHLCDLYAESGLQNPALIVDTNHSNSGKKYLEQVRIAKEVIHSANHNSDIRKLLKGMMIESYIEDGCQKASEGVYGKSITDPCLGWEKSEKLIYELAELW